MISDTTFRAIGPAHLELKARNVTLGVVKDSAMMMLNEAANTPLLGMSSVSDAEFFERFPTSLIRDSITGSTESCELAYQDGEKVLMPPVGEHELVMKAIVDMGRTRTGELMDYSRNVMQPFITTVIDNYAEPSTTDLVEQWSIVDISLHSGFLNPLVETLLGQYASPEKLSWETPTSRTGVNLPAELPTPVTGRSSFDALVTELLASLNMTPHDALNKLFSDGIESPYAARAWVKSPLRLVQWLLISYYETEPWENCGLSGLAWDNFCIAWKHALTGWIATYVTNLGQLIESNTLIMGTDLNTREIYVVTDVYRNFVQNHGGKAEAIYGAMYLTEDRNRLDNYMLSTFVNRAVECEQAWARQASIAENKLNSEWVITARAHMKRSFCDAIDALESGILPDDMPKSAVRTTCGELIDKYLDRYAMEDPTLLILTVASEGVFTYADCGWVLTEIHKHMCLGVPANEAATQAAIDYTINWSLSALQVL